MDYKSRLKDYKKFALITSIPQIMIVIIIILAFILAFPEAPGDDNAGAIFLLILIFEPFALITLPLSLLFTGLYFLTLFKLKIDEALPEETIQKETSEDMKQENISNKKSNQAEYKHVFDLPRIQTTEINNQQTTTDNKSDIDNINNKDL